MFKAFLLVALTLAGVQSSDLGLTTSYDRFKDQTTVKVTESLMPDRPGYVLFSAVALVKGRAVTAKPKRVIIAIDSYTDDWYFVKTKNVLRVIQDGERSELGEMQRANAEVRHRGVVEQLVLDVPFSAVQRLSRSSHLEIQVGRYETAISSTAIENLKRWVAQFPSTQ